MIEKIPGCPRIDKLRVIHLYEADYNLGLRIYWSRKAVWNAHLLERLDPSQAGSRPGKRCIDVVLQKELKFLYSRLTCSSIATADNDAKSCYDRMICNLATIASRYNGLSHNICKTHASTLEKMKYIIRTAIGDSALSYSNTHDNKVHGTGQGSSASPAIWLMISVLLIEVLKQNHKGMCMISVDKRNTIYQIIEGFVDDTSIYVNSESNNIDRLLEKLQEVLQEWNDLLYASGGKLELPKCFFYILQWEFDDQGTPHPKQMDHIPHQQQLSIYDTENNQTVTIQQKICTEAHKTLGVFKTIISDDKNQLQYLQNKSDTFANLVVSGHLSRRQALTAYSSIYIPSMLYSTSVCNHTAQDLQAVQTTAIQRFLPAMGYERTFPRAVVFAPLTFGGLGLSNLYVDSSIQKIYTILSHIRANTELGQQLQMILDWTQLIAGISIPILETKETLGYINNNWFIGVMGFLQSINGRVSIQNGWLPTKETLHDIILMDEVINLNLSKTDKKIFNNWRLFFQVISLSDILREDGNSIDGFFTQIPTTRNNNRWKSNLSWPNQKQPHKRYFSIWTNTIEYLFNKSRSVQSIYTSKNDWLHHPKMSRNQWETYFSKAQNCVYKQKFNSTLYTKYHYLHNNRSSSTFQCRPNQSELVCISELPCDCIPIRETQESIDIINIKSRQIRQFHSPTELQNKSDRTHYQSYYEYIQSLPQYQRQILQCWYHEGDDNEIFQHYQHTDTLLIATDGGYYNGKGSFGVIVATKDDILARMYGDAPGTFETHSSFRSECYGILGALTLLLTQYQFRIATAEIPSKTIIYCDNEGLVQRLNHHRSVPLTPSDFLQTESDVELQILHEFKELEKIGFKFTCLHVKGHQDKDTEFNELARPAQINVLADKLAGKRLKNKYICPYYELPASKIMLYINNTAITAGYKYFMRNAYLSQDLRSYMIKKFGWKPDIPDKIWWQPHGMAHKSLHNPGATRIKKWIFNHLPTNSRQKIIHKHGEATCQACGCNEEDDNHIVRCHCITRQKIRKDWIEALYHYLDSTSNTPKEVTRCIMRGVSSWLLHQESPQIESISYLASESLKKAYNEQTEIGWDHFLRGRISMEWSYLMRHSYSLEQFKSSTTTTKHNKQRYRTPESWAKGLISLNWEFVNLLWEDRINFHKENKSGSEARDQHYFLLQRAYHEIDNHRITNAQDRITNAQDRNWILKSRDELNKLSSNQLMLWIDNITLLNSINKYESTQNQNL